MDNFNIEKNGYEKKQVDNYVKELKADYENVLSEQKERIIELKKQLEESNIQLNKHIKKSEDISDALVVAVETAKQIENSSKNIYDLEIRRVRALYSKWESFLNQLLIEYPRLRDRFDTNALLKMFSDGIDDVIRENSATVPETPSQAMGLRNLINRMNNINSRNDAVSSRIVKNDIIKNSDSVFYSDKLTSIGTIPADQELIKQKKEAELLEKQKREQELIEKQKQEMALKQAMLEKERLERLAQENLAKQEMLKQEQERKRQEQLARLEQARKVKEEKQKQQQLLKEQARLEKERLEKERLEQEELLKQQQKEKFEQSYFNDGEQLISEDLFLNMGDALSDINLVEEQSVKQEEKTEQLKEVNEKQKETVEPENKKSQIKSISKIKIENNENFENLVDKFLFEDDAEDEKSSSYEKALLNKKKKDNGFDLSEALTPEDDLSEIMKSFDAFNMQINEEDKKNKK